MTLVSFSLNGVKYALDIFYVEEVIPLPEITFLAKLPSSFRGMINLRGVSVPIMDLRVCLGMDARPDALENDIIVIKVLHKVMGLIVDKVLDVSEIEDEECLPSPDVSDGIDLQYISGVAQLGPDFVSIIQLEALLNGIEKEDLQGNQV